MLSFFKICCSSQQCLITTKPLCHISTNPRVSVLHASLEDTCCLSFQIDEYLIGPIAWKLLLPLSCFCSFGLLHFFFYLQTHKLTQAGISWHRGKHLHRNRGWDTIHGDICTLKQQHRDYCYSCLFVFISGQTSSNKMLSGVRGCPWHHIKYNNEKQNQWNKQIQMHKCWECCCVAKCGQLLEFAAT